MEAVARGTAQEKDDKIAELKRKLLAVKPKQFAMAGASDMSLEDSVMAGVCLPLCPAPPAYGQLMCSPPGYGREFVQISWPIHHAPAEQLPNPSNIMMLTSVCARQDGMTSSIAAQTTMCESQSQRAHLRTGACNGN